MIIQEIQNTDGSTTILSADHALHLKDRFAGHLRMADGTEKPLDREAVAKALATMPERDMVRLSGIQSRRDLGPEHGFDIERDDDGVPLVFLNAYHCDLDNHEWSDKWDCGVDTECECCGKDLSPVESTWLGPKDAILQSVWYALPSEPLKPVLAPR
jgi:hypothetical protein